MREYRLGRLGALSVAALPSAFLAAAGLWAVLAAIGILALGLPMAEALAGGLVAALLHYAADMWHNLGHAWAAARTGYPMSGMRFWGLLGTCVYPKDEPALPGPTHVRRALGGPAASALLGAVAVVAALAAGPLGATVQAVAWFFAADNLLVFTAGALVPLGFNDGSTLLRWRGKAGG
jgi:hypothetical protein